MELLDTQHPLVMQDDCDSTIEQCTSILQDEVERPSIGNFLAVPLIMMWQFSAPWISMTVADSIAQLPLSNEGTELLIILILTIYGLVALVPVV